MLSPELLLLAQIRTKSFVGWGFAPDPTGGAYIAPPDPLAGLRGPTSKGRGREGDREGRGKGGKGPRSAPPVNFLDPPISSATHTDTIHSLTLNGSKSHIQKERKVNYI